MATRDWLLVGLLAAVACDGGPPPESSPVAEAPDSAGSTGSASLDTAGDAAALDADALPEPGSALVWPSPRGATVYANQALRRGVLRDLARERRFELEVAKGTFLRGTVTLTAADVPLEEILPQVLEGLPYSLTYRVDEASGVTALSRVFVGEAEAPVTAAVSSAPKSRRKRVREPRTEEDPVERERRQRGYLEEFESEDSEVRANAVAFVRADRQTIPEISDLLGNDPDPGVRAAAASTLGESGESAAVNALLRALGDPDPAVVVEAIDGLEWTADASVIPEMEFLLGHPSGEIRERTVEAIEWLAD